MEYTESDWNGYRRIDFQFEDRSAILVYPHTSNESRNWLLKTEYFGAFPDYELEMLKIGFHLAYISNRTRWFTGSDADSKARFCEFLSACFDLNRHCVIVGMSCGGLQGVYFAAKYPQYVDALYLDAPVLNFLSCPCGIGLARDSMYEEFVKDTGLNRSALINYRDHPIDKVPDLVIAKLPVFLVCGDSDDIVPYEENGRALYEYYKQNGGDITLILKFGCNHHPHGLTDNTPLIDFTLKHCSPIR